MESKRTDRRAEPEWFFWLALAIALGVHFHFVTEGWSQALLFDHAFRQTQTLLTSYWFVEEGFQLDYQTPVFGPHWKMPLEFPLFQGIVALVHLVTDYPLDQSGRLVSLMFFYLTLIPTYFLVRALWPDRRLALMLLTLILVNPTYIYWTRAPMIESTVLFLSIAFLCFFVRALKHRRWYWHAAALAAGCLAALVKPTTFTMALMAALFIYLHHAWVHRADWSRRTWITYISQGAIMTLIPIGAAWLWTGFADSVKERHVLKPLLSDNLHTWNFGTVDMRFSWDVWRDVLIGFNGFAKPFHELLGIPLTVLFFLVLAAGALVCRRRLVPFLLIFLTYLFAPFVFLNLFYVHGYYQYAIAIVYCLLVAFIFFQLIKECRPWVRGIGVSLFMLTVTVQAIGYSQTSYYRSQQATANPESHEWFEFVRQNTRQDEDALLVFMPTDYNPVIAYHIRRKTWTRATPESGEEVRSPEVQAFKKNLAEEGMRVRGIWLNDAITMDVLAPWLDEFRRPGEGVVQRGPAILFVPKPDDEPAAVSF